MCRLKREVALLSRPSRPPSTLPRSRAAANPRTLPCRSTALGPRPFVLRAPACVVLCGDRVNKSYDGACS